MRGHVEHVNALESATRRPLVALALTCLAPVIAIFIARRTCALCTGGRLCATRWRAAECGETREVHDAHAALRGPVGARASPRRLRCGCGRGWRDESRRGCGRCGRWDWDGGWGRGAQLRAGDRVREKTLRAVRDQCSEALAVRRAAQHSEQLQLRPERIHEHIFLEHRHQSAARSKQGEQLDLR